MGEIRTGIRLEGDASGYRAASEQAAQAALKQAEAEKVLQEGLRRTTLSAGEWRNAMRTLPAQLTDIFTGLASGQAPMTVAIQQGGQLRDQFGGFSNVLRGVSSLITPTLLGFGSLAAGAATLGYALMQAKQEAADLDKQLALQGASQAYSRGQIQLMSSAIANRTGTPVGDVKELTQQLLSAGSVGRNALQEAQRAAVAMQQLTGASAADVAKSLSGAGRDAFQFAQEANRSYAFLSASEMDHVRTLQAQGKEAEATRVVLEKLADTLEQRVGPTMSWLDRENQKFFATNSAVWNGLKELLSGPTPEGRLKQLEETLGEIDSGKDTFGTAWWKVNSMRAEAAQLRERLGRDAARRAEASAPNSDAADYSKMLQLQDSFAAVERANIALRLAETNKGLQAAEESARLSYQRGEQAAAEHQRRLLALDLERIEAQRNALNEADDVLAGLSPQNEKEALSRTAARTQIQAQIAALEQRRASLLADERAGRRDITPLSSLAPGDAAAAARRADRLEEGLAQERAIDEQRRTQTLQSLARIEDENRYSSARLIQDAEARGHALLQIETEDMERRLALGQLETEERKALEDAFARWKVLRQRELTEQLKPEWQKMVEGWGDTTRQMRDAFDRTVSASIQAGEQAWISFTKTGKLSIKNLVDAMETEVARYGFRQFLSLGFSLFPFGGGSSGGGVGFEAGGVGASVGGGTGGRVGIARAGSSGLSMPVTIINQSGTPVQGMATMGDDGGLVVLLEAAESYLADRVSGGVGSLTQALGARFGLRSSLSS